MRPPICVQITFSNVCHHLTFVRNHKLAQVPSQLRVMALTCVTCQEKSFRTTTVYTSRKSSYRVLSCNLLAQTMLYINAQMAHVLVT
jgi:hypothetical protein